MQQRLCYIVVDFNAVEDSMVAAFESEQDALIRAAEMGSQGYTVAVKSVPYVGAGQAATEAPLPAPPPPKVTATAAGSGYQRRPATLVRTEPLVTREKRDGSNRRR